MKPLIGLTSYFVEASEIGKNRSRGSYDQDMIMATNDYAKSIERAGGIPVILPCTQDEQMIKDYVSRVDALLFCGGEDIHPIYFNQPMKKGLGMISPLRDAFEWMLLKEGLFQNKPILGICRGLQLINVFYGGTLIQDLDQMDITTIDHNRAHVPKYLACHEVEIYVNTHLYDMVQKGKIQVNSRHHQSIDVLGENLVVSSKALDGIIEGIEDPDRAFMMAVQWHPEMMSENDPIQRAIFNGFIRHCKK